MNDLVLIPGLGSDAAVWSPTIGALAGDPHSIVGHPFRDRSHADMAHRILAAAPPFFALAGLSMGGMVALEIMRADRSRVTHLALIDSNASADTPEQAEQRRRTLAAIRAGVDLRSAGRQSLGWLVHADAPSGVRDDIVDMGVRVGAQTYARQIEAVLHRPEQRSVLETVDVPATVISGAEDLMVPVDCARAIARAIRGSELTIIPACGHLPPIEKPRETADLLRSLLAR